MRRLLVPMLLVLPAADALADRISNMTREERCVYVARLHAAAAYHHSQGRARDQVTIHWHGDETENEVRFVNGTIDRAYAIIDREAQRGRNGLPPEFVGDEGYATCIRESES